MLHDTFQPADQDAGSTTIADPVPMPIAASACEQLHQYEGNNLCGSRCTLDFAHNGSHVCGQGHSF